jgi:hypothetical protein
VECATKNQKYVVILYYSPCDDTPTATTVALTTGGVLQWLCTARGSKETKNKFLQIISDSPPVVTATSAQWEYRHMGCIAQCHNAPLSFW